MLYLINGESGGNARAVGDGGLAQGLFQSHYIDPHADPETQFKDARRLYDGDLANGGSGFGDWGEGRLYQGKPFGALGNNPYGPVNGRANVADAIKPTTKPQVSGDSKNPSLAALIKLQGKPITSSAKSVVKTNAAGYSPSGNWAQDTGAYWDQAQAAYGELANYQSGFDGIIQVDENAGIVYQYDPDVQNADGSVGGLVPDDQGTKLLQKAQAAERSLDRLLAGKKAGLLDTGEGSAAAYLANEKERRASASADYEDYQQRIADLVAVEDIPLARAANVASLLKATTDSEHKNRSGFGTAGQAQRTNLQPYADSMRAAIPTSAPKPISVQGAADGLQTPTVPQFTQRTPEAILEEYHGGATPAPVSTAGAVGSLPTQTMPDFSNITAGVNMSPGTSQPMSRAGFIDREGAAPLPGSSKGNPADIQSIINGLLKGIQNPIRRPF